MSIEFWTGLLATVVSCAALVAVVISVRLQSREIRVAREQAARANQLNLVTVLMEHPHIRIEPHATRAEILELQRRLSSIS